MSKREEVESYLPAANIQTYRGWVASVVGLEVSELTADGWNDRSSVKKRRIAAYLLRSAMPGHLNIRDVAIIMKKSEPWVTKSIHYIEKRMTLPVFKDQVNRMTAEYEKLDDNLLMAGYLKNV